MGNQEQFYGCADIEICANWDTECLGRVGQVDVPKKTNEVSSSRAKANL